MVSIRRHCLQTLHVIFTDWVILGNGDMTFYVPMGVEIAKENLVKVQHLTGA